MLRKTDLAILVADDATAPLGETEQALLDLCRARNIPWILVRSKADLLEAIPEAGRIPSMSAPRPATISMN